MTVVMVGGLKRLERHYLSAAAEERIDLRILNRCCPEFSRRIGGADAVILFTDLVSHESAKQVYQFARTSDLCLVCSHNSSLTAAKRCLREAKQQAETRAAR